MHAAAIEHLRKDPVLGRIIEEAGACTLEVAVEGTHFHYLVAAIVHQQLAGAAARTIHGRVLAIYGGRAPEPQELLATPDRELRRAGLSGQKLSYLRDLARRAATGDVPLDALDTLPDDEIIAALTRVKGIGRWTSHMFLMFRLGRADILPELDYGVRKAMQIAYRMRKLPEPRRMLSIAASWSPYRTVASWYLWRSLELPGVKRTKRPRSAPGARRSAKGGKSKGGKSKGGRTKTRRARR